MNQIREIHQDEYKELYNHMKRDFTSDERAPYFAIKHNLEKKIYDGFYMTDDNTKIRKRIEYKFEKLNQYLSEDKQ